MLVIWWCADGRDGAVFGARWKHKQMEMIAYMRGIQWRYWEVVEMKERGETSHSVEIACFLLVVGVVGNIFA